MWWLQVAEIERERKMGEWKCREHTAPSVFADLNLKEEVQFSKNRRPNSPPELPDRKPIQRLLDERSVSNFQANQQTENGYSPNIGQRMSSVSFKRRVDKHLLTERRSVSIGRTGPCGAHHEGRLLALADAQGGRSGVDHVRRRRLNGGR